VIIVSILPVRHRALALAPATNLTLLLFVLAGFMLLVHVSTCHVEHQQLLSLQPLNEFRATNCKRSGVSAIGVSSVNFILSRIYENEAIFKSK
jgi:hypothetical protein